MVHVKVSLDRDVGNLLIEFDRNTGEALNEARVTVRIVDRLFTKENPLIGHAVVGGTMDLANRTLQAEGYLEGSIPPMPQNTTVIIFITIVGAVFLILGIMWYFTRHRRRLPT
jgi:hypothetical protein